MAIKHIGFGGAVKSVQEKEGVSKESAQKIIGAGKAKASVLARKKNPRLNRTGVLGGASGGGQY